jgi:Gas vesicle protein
MTDRPSRLPTAREVSLVEILDRALGAGVVITGDLTISLADVDLVYLDLRLLLGSVGTIRDRHSYGSAGDLPPDARGDGNSW